MRLTQKYYYMKLSETMKVDGVQVVKRDSEYDAEFTSILEFFWGEGCLSPGGMEAVDMMFEGVDLNGKKVLDLGSGLGGPAIYLARQHAADITGLDVDEWLLAEAKANALKVRDFTGSVSFKYLSDEGHFPFDDDSFDIVYSKESLLHVEDKDSFFEEIRRVLKPGGVFVNNDWMHKYGHESYSEAMEEFVLVDGLTFNLITPNEYQELLRKVGFEEVAYKSTVELTLRETNRDLAYMAKETDAFKEKFGEENYETYLKSWELQRDVFENGEMLTGVFWAK